MLVHVLSVIPEYFDGPFRSGPVRRALTSGSLLIEFVNPRDFASDRHRTVDDYPFGGGAGMVMKPEPLHKAVETV
ncbi:MAG: tRNA (guanosine(37)-N1)-methyltransferase TrmD, partial [candidate division WOR-3 bacterium]